MKAVIAKHEDDISLKIDNKYKFNKSFFPVCVFFAEQAE
jgi:hypothetical protein